MPTSILFQLEHGAVALNGVTNYVGAELPAMEVATPRDAGFGGQAELRGDLRERA